MKIWTRLRGAIAAMMAATLVGGLTASPIVARADDPPKGKSKEKKPEIPIKIVDPIIVPDKGKDKKGR